MQLHENPIFSIVHLLFQTPDDTSSYLHSNENAPKLPIQSAVQNAKVMWEFMRILRLYIIHYYNTKYNHFFF